ncbi:MAG: ribosomal protein S18-alanine N-acetyltransferase [Cellvibrionaceae bacterium]
MQLSHKGREYQLMDMSLDHLPQLLAIEQQSHSHPWSEANFISSISSSHHCLVLIEQTALSEQTDLSDKTALSEQTALSQKTALSEKIALSQKAPLSDLKIAAYIITSTAADEAELLNITVAPQFRRCGLASLLLEHAETSFDTTIQNFFLEVRQSNANAIALYDTLGFNEVGCRPNYYPANGSPVNHQAGREDALIMAKTLGF